MESESLRAQFSRIRRLYFPKWSAGKYWKVQNGNRRGGSALTGFCDTKRRIVFVSDRSDSLLIHEICHAVASSGHGIVWQRRMVAASVMALRLGNVRVANELRDEVAAYQNAILEVQRAKIASSSRP